nr:sulfotransferase [Rubrivivax gelatinosus]
MLPPDLPVLSVVTVRHPIDSYIALSGNGWIHHAPGTFDEYCRRYQAFLDRHDALPTVRYEDFVERPEPTMRALCELLQLPFREDFVQLFPAIRLTGDSGRGGEQIAERPRRRPPPPLCAELLASHEVGPLCARLGYAPSTLQEGLEPPPASTGDR